MGPTGIEPVGCKGELRPGSEALEAPEAHEAPEAPEARHQRQVTGSVLAHAAARQAKQPRSSAGMLHTRAGVNLSPLATGATWATRATWARPVCLKGSPAPENLESMGSLESLDSLSGGRRGM